MFQAQASNPKSKIQNPKSPRGAVPVRGWGRPRRHGGPGSLEGRPRVRLSWRLVGWIFGRLVALGILMGASWLLYDGGTSPDFRVARVRIVGNQLASATQVEAAAAVGGKNVFWLKPGEVAKRLEALPAVAAAHVEVLLPDLVEVRVREREPFAVWQSGGSAFLVDESGMILAPELSAPRLSVVRDLSQQPVQPGDRVDADALKAASLLSHLLAPSDGEAAPSFDYQSDTGIEVPDLSGWRVRFGSSQDLAWKVSALQAIRAQLAEAGAHATFVDLRFRGRPYYR
ncbi:MAG: FtsQ-type POTRA domain-containing protein [Chloroflexi bacterium]|nr:FtsQ-type POTRA domain-containing protein [Chloroflexota bacterium]